MQHLLDPTPEEEIRRRAYEITTTNAGKVYGTLDLTVISKTTGGNLSLAGTLTGTSNGTPSSTGTLSNGVVVGKWTLSPGINAPNFEAGNGIFVMCQGAATCSADSDIVIGSLIAGLHRHN